MMSFHRQLANLWDKKKRGIKLTKAEEDDFRHCLDANLSAAWKLRKLENMSLAASIINDTEMQHEVCAQIEKMTSYSRNL